MIERTRVGRFALYAAAMTALGALQPAAADTTTQFALTGSTTAPGAGGGTVGSIVDAPTINNSGQVAFATGVSGASDGTSLAFIRGEANGTLTLITRNQQPAPGGGGGTIFTMFLPTINNVGQAMIGVNLTGTSDGSTQGFLRGDGSGPVTALFRDHTPAFGLGGGTIGSISSWTYGDNSAVTVNTTITGSSDGSTRGIFQGNGSTVAVIVREKNGAVGPGGGTFTSALESPVSNSFGHVAFKAGLTGTSNGSFSGVFRSASGTMTNIARDNQTVPTGGTITGFFGIPQLNNAGQVAFTATLNSADGATRGVFRGDGVGPLATIARHLQSAPGGGVFGAGFESGDMLMNNSGQVLFQAPLIGAPDFSAFGLFRGDGSSLTAIARQGQVMPGGGNIFTIAADAAFNNTGAALYNATLANASDDHGLFLSDGRDTLAVVRKAQALGGSTVVNFNISQFTYAGGFNSINDAGQVVYTANLADGSNGVFRYTPALHWRNSFGGGWNTADNWTLGINPGSMHDVIVDPQFGGGITGPTADTTVNTLVVAGKQGDASLSLETGSNLSISGATTIKSTGSINVGSGKLTGASVVNDGSLSVTVGGQLSISTITNNNNVSLSGPTTVNGPITNNGIMNVSHATLTGGPLTNNVNLNLDAAIVSNSITNEVGGLISARGNVTGLINNRGTINITGLLTINNINNAGLITVDAGESIGQGSIMNSGVITLAGGGITSGLTNNSGGIIQGGGGISTILTNNAGALLYANNPTYPLSTSISTNNTGARIRVADGSTLNISNSLSNLGLVTLGGEDANLNVGSNQTITNNSGGIISGAGTISASVSNFGTVHAEGGLLLITGGGGSNQGSGLLQVSEGATLLFAQGINSNSGTINVSGGSFINNSVTTFSNSGKISGYGTFTSANFTNGGTMTFTGGFTTINGTVINSSTRKIEVANDPALFTGNVTNFGIFKNTRTSITFGGTYTENGTFISDPADNLFSDVTIGEAGAWVGGVGDRFFVSGDFFNRSTQAAQWETSQAELHLITGGTGDVLQVNGMDTGVSFAGYEDNFAWGTLSLAAGRSLTLIDADAIPGGAVYVDHLDLQAGLAQIGEITGNGLNLYYHLGNPANAYLGGGTYSLAGGGSISPVPEPGSIFAGITAAALLLARRRRGYPWGWSQYETTREI